MQLLDATLAMALTLAALATVVTIFMEAGLRAARMRKKNLVEVMKLLNAEISKGPLQLSPAQRWDFISRALQNPLEATTCTLAEQLERQTWFDRVCAYLNKNSADGKTVVKDEAGTLTEPGLQFYLDQIGQDKTGKRGKIRALLIFIGQFLGDNRRSSLYDKVSLEHLLRRLSEVEEIQTLAQIDGATVSQELNRLARKYEEFGSAVSASFKRSAQAWSIVIGIAFAILANVDGLRIFEAYQADKELVGRVIEQQSTFEQSYKISKQVKDDREAIEKNLNEAEQELQTLEVEQTPAAPTDTAQLAELKKKIKEQTAKRDSLQADFDKLVSIEQIKQTADKAQQQLADLVALGIPLGWELYPNCPYGDVQKAWQSSDAACRSLDKSQRLAWSAADSNESYWSNPVTLVKRLLNRDTPLTHAITTLASDPGGFLRWLFAVTVTGILIGLGAPFWFDVAKRLSQVRQGVREIASAEERLSGQNANGQPEQRKQIVDTIVSDITNDQTHHHRRLFD